MNQTLICVEFVIGKSFIPEGHIKDSTEQKEK